MRKSAAGPDPSRHDFWLVAAAVLYTPVHFLLLAPATVEALFLSMGIGFGATLIQRTEHRRFHSVTLGLFLMWMAALATVAVVVQGLKSAAC